MDGRSSIDEQLIKLSSLLLMKLLCEYINGNEIRVALPPIEILRRFLQMAKYQVRNLDVSEVLGPLHPNSITPSTKPFGTLKPMALTELLLEQHSEGKYVIVRILEHGIHVIGWLWLIEDDQGNACMLNVFNYPPLELFCPGTVLIVKEPFLKVNDIGIPIIRCDCPTDIIVLRRSHALYDLARTVNWKNELGEIRVHEDFLLHHSLTLTSLDWYEYGNKLFRDGMLALAKDSYELGLNVSCDTGGPTLAKLRSRLCVVYFELGYYEKTIAVADAIPHDVEAKFSAGKARYKLRNYEKAKEIFSTIMSRYPNHVENRKEFWKTVNRLKEQDDDMSNYNRLVENSRSFPLKKMEYGDFKGPVEVINVPGKGRGVRLTNDVPPETVLMVSKAFASNMGQKRFVNSVLKVERGILDQMELEAEIAETVFKNPETFAPLIFRLSTGAEPYKNVQLYCDPNSHYEPICDVTIVKAIRQSNSFQMATNIDGAETNSALGLFILPSFLNHSCLPNVYATFFNDVMVVRSIDRLKAGVELCINYFPGVYEPLERKRLINKRGFKCACRLCLHQFYSGDFTFMDDCL